MEKIKNNNIEKDILKQFNHMSLEELIKLYGDIPINIMFKPINQDINSSIENSLFEDSDVIFNEISNKNI